MPNNNENQDVLTNQITLLSEVVIKVAAIERILKDAGILTDEKMLEYVKKISEEISAIMASAALKDQLSPETKN